MSSARFAAAVAESDGTHVQSGNSHVRVADGLDLLDAALGAGLVELREELVQVVDQLGGTEARRRFGETDEVGHQHRHVVVAVGDVCLAGVESSDDRRGQNVEQQRTRTGPLRVQVVQYLVEQRRVAVANLLDLLQG